MSKMRIGLTALVMLMFVLSSLTGCGTLAPEPEYAEVTPIPTKIPLYVYVVFYQQPNIELMGMRFITEFADRTDCYGDGICYRINFSDNPSRDELLQFAFTNLKKLYPELSTNYETFQDKNPELWGIAFPYPGTHLKSVTPMPTLTQMPTPEPTLQPLLRVFSYTLPSDAALEVEVDFWMEEGGMVAFQTVGVGKNIIQTPNQWDMMTVSHWNNDGSSTTTPIIYGHRFVGGLEGDPWGKGQIILVIKK